MRGRFRFAQTSLVVAGLLTASTTGSTPAEFVDLELLLAVDVSASVDAEEYVLQMQALAGAFRHPDVVSAIRGFAPRGVAVALMQWAGQDEQVYAVPWSIVGDHATAAAFAERIDIVPRPRTFGGTAIGDALIAGLALLTENDIEAARHVIDVSGDGSTNQGTSPGPVRTYAASLSVTVNGLAILNEEPDLMLYYRDRVIGGPGAFVLKADDYQDFNRAIQMKLIREIEGILTAAATPAEVAASIPATVLPLDLVRVNPHLGTVEYLASPRRQARRGFSMGRAAPVAGIGPGDHFVVTVPSKVTEKRSGSINSVVELPPPVMPSYFPVP